MKPNQPRFWPLDPGRRPDTPQPEDIFREAAAELGRLTSGEVIGELQTTLDRGDIVYAFYLVSEAVGYRYVLFRAMHRLGYPVTIFDRATEKSSMEDNPFESSPYGKAPLKCANANELEEALRDMFQHPVTQQIVGQLQNLSRAAS